MDGLLLDLQARLKPELWEFINYAAHQAEERHWHLYLVGGIVRDLLIHKFESCCPIQFTDIDLVVDGATGVPVSNGGIELAKALQRLYPNTRLELHPKFQTADLIWKHDPEFNSLSIDFATARTEQYPYPGASPVVQASSIREDLYRRDFTVNAFALRLTQPHRGELLDFFGGQEDLRNRIIRSLHHQSFIDDPTRIYRAVRYTLRLNYELDQQTKWDIEAAIDSGIHREIQRQQTKVPGVQTRLKKELKSMFEAPYWHEELQQLSQLGALKCIHPNLTLENHLYRKLRAVDRGLRWFPEHPSIIRWLLLLELLLTRLPSKECYQVAMNLQLSEESLERLQNFYQFQDTEIAHLENSQVPSEIVRILQPKKISLLILIVVSSHRSIRRKVWQYLTHWMQLKPILNGETLKQMGYRPGPLFRQILEEIRVKTLDGEFIDSSQAKAWILQQYPHLPTHP